MKKIVLVIGIMVIIIGVFVACGSEKMIFTESGLNKDHIVKMVVTNDVTKKTTEVIDADGVDNFLGELNNIKMPKEEVEKKHTGCNTPGQNKYYIELMNNNGEVIGDVIISKAGGILLKNFSNEKIVEVLDEAGAKKLEEIIEKNINP